MLFQKLIKNYQKYIINLKGITQYTLNKYGMSFNKSYKTIL